MEIIEKVKALIAEIDKTHNYSMSRIYGLYNEVFSVAETPQSCASCLIRKVNQLKEWLAKQPTEIVEKAIITDDPLQPIKSVTKKRGRKPKNN